MRCTDPGLEMKSAARPLSIKAKDLLVTARVWQPTRLTGEIAGPLTVAEPGQSSTLTLNWRHAQTEVRGLPTAPQQVTIVLDEPVLDRTDGTQPQRLFNASRAELVGKMLEGSARNNPVIEVALKLAAAAAPTLHPLTGRPLDADITAVLRGLKDFAPKPWPDRFREIQAAGGRIEISSARVRQGETVAAVRRRRLRGQPRVVHRGVQEVSGPVAGEHPAGAVAAVRGRCQTHDEQCRVGRAETGHRAAPVRLVAERGTFVACHLLAPRHQPRAGPAVHQPVVHPLQTDRPALKNVRDMITRFVDARITQDQERTSRRTRGPPSTCPARILRANTLSRSRNS